MDVMDQGRMTVFVDPTGAHCATWQPGIHKGAELVNEPGSFCWNELYTRDLPRDLDFYRSVFNYTVEETEMGSGGKYNLLKVGGRPVAGAMNMDTVGLPAEIPPHWLVYFAVSDIQASMSKVTELGGSARGPMDTPMVDRSAIITDPVGAVFAIIQFQSQG